MQKSFNISITAGVCDHIQVARILSEQLVDPVGVHIGTTGLALSCKLHWAVQSTVIHSLKASGDVLATVNDSSIGSPLSLIMGPPENGSLALPEAIHAWNCSGQIKVTDLQFKGYIVSSILQVLSGFIKSTLTSHLRSIICSQVDTLVNKNGTMAIVNASAALRAFLAKPSVSPKPPEPLPEPRSDFVDFAANPGMRLITRLSKEVLGNPSSAHNLSAIVQQYLGHGGAFTSTLVGFLPFTQEVRVQSLATLNITLNALSGSGLDTWSEFTLGSPQAQRIAFSSGFDHLSFNASVRLVVTFPDRTGPLKGHELDESFDVAVDLNQLFFAAGGFLAINGCRLGTLSLDQFGDVGCVAPAVYSALNTAGDLRLASLRPWTWPTKGGSLEEDLDRMLNVVLTTFLGQLDEVVDAVTHHLLSVTVPDELNARIHAALATPRSCADPEPVYAYPGVASAAGFTAIGLVLVAALVLVPGSLVVRRWRKLESMRRLMRSSTTEVASGSLPLATGIGLQPIAERSTEVLQGGSSGQVRRWDCLAYHPDISGSMRAPVPTLIVANMLIFVYSNSKIGTNIIMNIKTDGQDIVELPPLQSFTLVSSVTDMWDAKVYILAVLIVGFSGVWPYIKLLSMLFCWFAPTSTLTVSARQKLLDFLDAYGKWSLVDTFVLVMFMVAFNFNLSEADGPSIVADIIEKDLGSSATVQVFAQPLWAFHCFLIATLLSLVLGHVVTACHRYAHKVGEYGVPDDQGSSRNMRLCNVLRPEGVVKGRIFVYVPGFALVTALILVVVGLLLNTFQFTFYGMAALALGPERSMRPFSVISLATALPSASPDPNSFGTRWIQLAFVCFSIVFVLAYNIILVVLWWAPLSNKVQRRLLVSAQVLNAWSALEVFMLSIMAGVLEIQQFAKFIVGTKCDKLDEVVAKIPSLADMIPGGVSCFDVKTELKEGFWILLVSVLLSMVMGQLMMARCSTALCTPQSRLNTRENSRATVNEAVAVA